MNQLICGQKEIAAFNALHRTPLYPYAKQHAHLGFGVTITRAPVRAQPSLESRPGQNGLDLLQECSCLPATPVLILRKQPGWLYVQTELCAGWMPEEAVGLTEERTARALLQQFRFYLVTDPWVEYDGEQYFMSSALPAEPDGAVLLPYRENEMLCWRRETPREGMRLGYLAYKRCNLVSQAVKLLGLPYDWGERDGSVDCSALTMYTYACCGVKLPRNSGEQAAVEFPVRVLPVERACEALAGDLLHQPGHIMLSLGGDTVVHASYTAGKVCISKL